MASRGLRKFKFERQVGRSVVNPLVAAMDRIGVRSSLVVELETTGAKSGQPRRVPLDRSRRRQRRVGDLAARPPRRVGAQHRRRPEGACARRQPMAQRHSHFRAGRRRRARARSFGGDGKLSQSATALTMRAMESDPISVRITYD